MVFGMAETQDERALYAKRKKELIDTIKRENQKTSGLVMLIAGFEHERERFRQESSFYYYTGIVEPGVIWAYDLATNKSTLYIPNCGDKRAQWVHSPVQLTQSNAKALGVDEVAMLGSQCAGYQLFPFFQQTRYSVIVEVLKNLIEHNGKLFTLAPSNEYEYIEQRLVLERLEGFIPGIQRYIVDISPIVAQMRRTKDMHEIDLLCKAISITELAHEAGARSMEVGASECEVQANIEYMMTGACAQPAFPSIVAAGKQATILHYMANDQVLENGQLVVVDIGASFDGYCADLTRTYPVSGKFTKRQRELYDIVLATQGHIADHAKPGYFLNNPEHQEKSLHHLAQKFLAKYKLDQYFIHGIGHFLGLDVHDVGNPREALKEGDVITIEPGVYIPEEGIGIRIEDNYWIVKNGAVCLSENLPKKASAIEELVQKSLQDDAGEDEDDESMHEHDDDDIDLDHDDIEH